MDTISHGLYSVFLVKGIFKKGKLWLAFLFGILPDIIPFGIPFIQKIISGISFSKDNPSQLILSYTHFLYNFTHSIVIAFVIFGLIYLFKKRIYVWMLGWPLHILVDIPTHSNAFFPTPLLYPISNFTINGIGWGNPYIFFPNWILIAVLFFIVFNKEIKMFFKKLRDYNLKLNKFTSKI